MAVAINPGAIHQLGKCLFFNITVKWKKWFLGKRCYCRELFRRKNHYIKATCNKSMCFFWLCKMRFLYH